MCSIVVGIRGIPISSRIKRAPLPLWGLTPLLPPGKLSPSLSSAPDGLTSPLFPAASVSLFLFRSVPPPPLSSSLLFPARLPKSSLSLFHARARDEGWRDASFSHRFLYDTRTYDSIRLGSPSGWKVFESLDPLDSRILGKEKSEFSRESSISRIGNRFFREVSFSIGENFRELSKIRRRIDF